MSEHASGRRLRKKRALRDSIVSVAARLFVERGFDETRMDAISEAADIAVGTVYNYFKTKTELLVAILVEDVETFVRETRTLVSHPDHDTGVALAAVGTVLIAAMERRPRSLWRQLFGQALIDSTQLGPAYTSVERTLLGVLQTLLESQRSEGDLDQRFTVEGAAEIAFALANTLVYAYCRNDEMTSEEFAVAYSRQLHTVFGPAP